MFNKLSIYSIVACVIITGLCITLWNRISYLNSEVDIQKSNVTTLLDSVSTYVINDSINVASAKELQLQLSDFKRFRADDYKLITNLKADNKRLQNVTTAQTQTIHKLSGTVRDSLVYINNIVVDTIRCVTIHDKWFDLQGCIKNNILDGSMQTRDSLLYVEHIVPKRFLGFLWKYGVKERRQEILSKNPNTKILNAEFITIRD